MTISTADWVLYQLGDGGVPVIAFAIIEHTVSPDHQVIRIAVGYSYDDVHGLVTAFAFAFAVGQVGT